MKKFMTIVLTLLMVLGFSTMASAAMVFADLNGNGVFDTVEDTYLEINIGETKTFDIWATGITDVLASGVGIGSFGINMYFNFDAIDDDLIPPQVGFNSAAVGSDWTFKTADINPYNPSNGDRAHIFLSGTSLMWVVNDFAPGTGVTDDTSKLGTVELQCLGIGLSSLDLDVPSEDTAGFMLDNFDEAGSFDYMDVTVNQVPIPGTLLLLGSGLAGLFRFRKRTKEAW